MALSNPLPTDVKGKFYSEQTISSAIVEIIAIYFYFLLLYIYIYILGKKKKKKKYDYV